MADLKTFTLVITDKGSVEIKELDGTRVVLWNSRSELTKEIVSTLEELGAL